MMKKKPKVLFIAPLPPPVHGSAMVSQQIKDSKLINSEFDCDFVNLSTSRKMDEIQKFSIAKIFRLLGIYLSIFWKLLTKRFDLCYTAIAVFGTPFLKDAPTVLLCKLFGRKVLIHQHNKGMSTYAEKPFFSILYRWVYKSSSVALLSWRLYDDIKRVVKREQVVILPNGIAPSVIEKAEHRKENTVVRLLYLSNLVPSKGCNDLLEACSIMKQRGVPFHCVFIGGDCPEQSGEQFKVLIREKGLSDSVFYLGKKYGTDKDEFFRNADIFVFPTYYPQECFPLVLLEAMHYELPCVTTSEAAIPDIIENGKQGLICPPHNQLALADAIQWMILHPKERRVMGLSAKEKYEKTLTNQHFEANLLRIFKELI